ncbi:MAG: hypothetical protein PHD04_02860 [Candidatus Pacebacteria bacterium]|nr:hypothetical protein [Candidatus Paceibacterota bacterium]
MNVELNEQQKRELQNAALKLAAYQHQDDPEVSRLQKKVQALDVEIVEKSAALERIHKDRQIENNALRGVLLAFIPQELR